MAEVTAEAVMKSGDPAGRRSNAPTYHINEKDYVFVRRLLRDDPEPREGMLHYLVNTMRLTEDLSLVIKSYEDFVARMQAAGCMSPAARVDVQEFGDDSEGRMKAISLVIEESDLQKLQKAANTASKRFTRDHFASSGGRY